MFLKKTQMRAVAIAAMTVFTVANLPAVPVQAAIIGNDIVAQSQAAAEDRALVYGFMDRSDVQAKFEELGVDPAEAKKRVAALSDAEVARMARHIEEMPAGQGFWEGVLFAGLLIFLVLLLTDILGFTDVFGFTRKGSANPSS